MSSGSLDLDPSLARHKLAGPEFFYSNLRIQETLTTIRYGIEARKGLTLITGAPGIGKSTLLRKVATELAGHTTCVFEADPRVSFSDVLRLILRNLDGDHSEDNESAMVHSCRIQLRARLDRCQIVALFLDNAHQFPDQTLRSIMQTFLSGSAEDPEGTLLQLILAGRDELKTKISRATLTAIRRRKPIVCELQSLSSGEIATFIEKGLQASNQPPDTFDESAIKRIALYANGNPGTVNEICERALQLAGDSTEAKIPAELIETAVTELDLRGFDNSSDSETFGPLNESVEFDSPKPSMKFATQKPKTKFDTLRMPRKFDNDQDIPHKFLADEGISNASVFPLYSDAEGVHRRVRKKRTSWVPGLACLILLAGAAAMIGTDSLNDMVRNGITTLNQIATPYLQSTAQSRTPTEAPLEKPIETERLVPLPGPDSPAEIREDTSSQLAAKSETPAPSLPENLSGDPRSTPKPKVSSPNQARVPPAKVNSAQREDLQTQITRAIENRAIMGVEVSVVQGTAYLDGHVATERQRRAAERAARSVAGVERVHNRIAITFG